jgi:serine/threonine protein kinase
MKSISIICSFLKTKLFYKVYLMRDKVRRKFVCVKVIKIKNIPKKEREATKVEVELLRRLNHPNIVRYIDSFLSKNSENLCIAMEYCDGGDLASQIKVARNKLFSEDKILHWFVQISLGVHYMHTNNVLHRDLKTQNIFLLGNGRLVLGDLGISKVLEGTMDFAQTCIGTPYYMSPEIFQNKPYSYKSDVWALGCVLYEMTTLNHAFDANSLNGLAQKIIKGRYPPIHHKYSRYLRELIGQMLLAEPKQRPDLDQILRKPFIKKHIINFFLDINSRPSASLGEGTMIVKAAVGGPQGDVGNDVNMLSFKQQLESLGMAREIAEALQPKKSEPQNLNDQEAARLLREQANALKREKDHRAMVEAALEKLRIERESRAQARGAPIPGVNNAPRDSKQVGGGMRDNQPNKPAALRQPSRVSSSVAAGPPSKESVAPSSKDSVAANARRDRNSVESEQQPKPKRSLVAERERKIAEDRRKAEAQEYEDRRREEIRRREEAKRQEDTAEKLRKEQLRAQEDAIARREQQRERERDRQSAEIEQLRRDKLELDRRTAEREKLREDRRTEERRKLDDARREQLGNMQDKLGEMQDQVNKLDINRSEKKDLSTREKVLQRRQEKQAREEEERLEQLRLAENENKRIREQAYNQQRNQFHPSDKAPPGKGKYSPSFDDDEDSKSSSRKGRDSMGLDELTAKLYQAGGNARYNYVTFLSPKNAYNYLLCAMQIQ